MKTSNQTGFSVVEALLVLVVVGILGFTGWYVYHTKKTSDKDYSAAASSTVPKYEKKTNAKTTTTVAANPYSGWKTYTSSFEGLSFKYPTTWKSISPAVTSPDSGADSFELQSPVGAMTVSWISSVSGIGGACSSQIMPGTQVSSGSLGPCPYWTVLDSQKLSNANLYYVDGVVTNDGTTYSPWCALQASSGIVKSESNIGYLLFSGKHNNLVGLMCGKPFGSEGLLAGTKAEAAASMSTSEAQQAKLILLSAAY